LWWWYSG